MKRQPRSDNAETLLDGLEVPESSHRPPPTPERIGAYRLEDRLGIGGMGEVFLAWDEKLQRRVAIKRIRQDIGMTPEQRERFRREARLAARLSHPNVVQIHELVSDGAEDAIVMELLEGRTVEERLAAGRLETAEVLRLALEIAEGLAAAHDARLVHRDLKAANVLITRAGHAKILDFGLARPVVRAPEDQGFTRQGVVLGTCHAMSPEQARGEEVDERSDLFSFGALVHEMLTGRPPFRGNDHIDSLRRVVTEEPVDPRLARPDLPAEAAALLRRLLAKNRDDRPANAHEVIEVLERLRASPSGSHTAALDGSADGFSSGTATRLEIPEPFYRDLRGTLSLSWTRRLLLAGAVVVLVVAGAVALGPVVSTARQREVRNEDAAAFWEIRNRVEAGEARRDDLVRLEEMLGTNPDFMEKGGRLLAARIACALFAAQREPADLEKAAALIDEARALSPNDPGLLRQALRIALAGSRTGDAETILERLEELTPRDPEILPLGADLAELQGRPEKAEELLIEAVEQAPTTWRYRDRLVVFLAGQGRIIEARLQIDTILEQDPNNVWARERLGNLELSYGELDRAETIYRGLLEHVPERAFGNLATVLELRDRPREAAVYYRRALEVRSDHVAARVNLAEVEKELGNEGRAAELYAQALSRLERIEEGAGLTISEALLKAQCLARLGRTREAIEIARRRSDRIRDEPHLLLQSALIYSLAGDRAAALAAAEAALDKGLPQRWFASPAFRWLRESPELRSRFRPAPSVL